MSICSDYKDNNTTKEYAYRLLVALSLSLVAALLLLVVVVDDDDDAALLRYMFQQVYL